MENWKDIEGYEGLYQISDLGRVKSLKRTVIKSDGIRQGIGEKIRPDFDYEGYRSIRLSKDSKAQNYKIHRLVAMAFIPNPENKETVNHINGKKHDNRVENLEWNTRAQNMQHASRIGLCNTSSQNVGAKNGMSKLNDESVREIRNLISGKNAHEIARLYNVTPSLIYLVVNNKIWKHA